MKIEFPPEKSLFSLPVVHWCGGLSFGIATLITLIIAYNLQGRSFDFSGTGFNQFAYLYKVPAALLAIGFTLIGLCAANHRSEQTKKQIERTLDQIGLTTKQISLTNNQIELTKIQNSFTNYFKHLEEFDKFTSKIDVEIFKIQSQRNLHFYLFPNVRKGDYSLNNEFLVEFEKSVRIMGAVIKHFKGALGHDGKHGISSVIVHIKQYTKDLNIIIKPELTQEGKALDNFQEAVKNPNTYINDIVELLNYISKIMQFDETYKASESLIYLSSANKN